MNIKLPSALAINIIWMKTPLKKQFISMKKIIIPLLIFTFALTGCSKWLDVKPEDKFIEDQVFNTPQGFMDGLNGIYLKLGANNLYGRELTLQVPDLLAQYYYMSATHAAGTLSLVNFNYEDDVVKSRISGIWTNMYVNITNINRFLENTETYGSVLDEQTRAIMQGEAYGLRAYLYFDLVRMFAPSFKIDPGAKLIPYYDRTGYESAPFSTTTEVIGHILNDLQRAEKLLETSDPALTMTKVDQTTGIIDYGKKPYLKARNYHLNYYAIKGLQARVLLYADRKSEALAAAEAIIQKQAKFPWVQATEVNDPTVANRVFSPEILFAFENRELYEVYNGLFNPALADNTILTAGTNPSFLNAIFDNWANDYRYSLNWQMAGGKAYNVFFKYQDISNIAGRNYRYTISGIRMSEIYLIAAECENNSSNALAYLNEIRIHRNCSPLTAFANRQDDIMKEYRREFYGEGQLWYYYKRQNVSSLLSASSNTQKSITTPQFTFPIPLAETDPR
jgi:hypothetical protein